MRLGDRVWGLLFAALSVSILWHIRSFPSIPGQNIGPAAFPGLLALILLGCAIALLVRGIRHDTGWVQWGAWLRSPYHLGNFVATIAALAFYIVAAHRLGFLITAAILLAAMLLKLRVRPALALPITVVVVFVVHLIFYKMLRVTLPWGVLPVLY